MPTKARTRMRTTVVQPMIRTSFSRFEKSESTMPAQLGMYSCDAFVINKNNWKNVTEKRQSRIKKIQIKAKYCKLAKNT